MATFRPSGVSVYIRQDLDEGAARSGTTLIIDPIITKDGHRVAMSDIGDICFAKIDQGTSNEEIISFTGITDNTNTYTLTGCVWGYNFYNGTGSVSANQKKHISGSRFIITNDDHHNNLQLVDVDSTQTIVGPKTFTVTPKSNGGNPTVGTDLVIKSYVDALVLGTLTTINVIVPGTAGETITIGQLIYFDETDNEWKLTDADTAATVQNVLLGIAQGGGTNGNAITNGVLLQGVDANQSGLTEGDVQYAGNTAGAISASAGTTEVTVGLAKAATELYFNPRFNQQLTEDQQDALAGTSGTPSGTNKYVTNDDTATAATGDKVARRLAGGNLTVVTETASNNSTNAASTAYVDNQVTLAATKLLVSGATTTLTNSTTETDMLTLTLTGGSLSTNNAIEIYIPITTFEKTASAGNDIVFKLKYGATTLATVTTDYAGSGAVNNTGFIRATLNANAATNAQRGTMHVLLTTSGFQAGGIVGYTGFAHGTAAEDSTANKTLSITADWVNNSVGNILTWANAKAIIVK